MRLRSLIVADPVESVARQLAAGCERLAEERAIATTGERAVELATELLPEMVILSLELRKPQALEAAMELRRRLPETFMVVTFRELAVPTMERVGRLGVDDFMPQPVDLTAVFRAASRRFGVPFRRHERHSATLDVLRADGVLVGRTIDVSEGGLLLSAIHPIAVDDSLLLELALPGDEPLRVRSLVLEVQGQPPMPVTARIQFENLRGRPRDRLVGYLQTLARGSGG